MRKSLRRLIPSKVFYLWEKCGIKRIELFTQEDLAKKPEIHRDTAKLPPIPESSSLRKRLEQLTDRKPPARPRRPGRFMAII